MNVQKQVPEAPQPGRMQTLADLVFCVLSVKFILNAHGWISVFLVRVLWAVL